MQDGKAKSPTIVPCVGFHLNPAPYGGAPPALQASRSRRAGLHTAPEKGLPGFECWLKEYCPITNTVGDGRLSRTTAQAPFLSSPGARTSLRPRPQARAEIT